MRQHAFVQLAFDALVCRFLMKDPCAISCGLILMTGVGGAFHQGVRDTHSGKT